VCEDAGGAVCMLVVIDGAAAVAAWDVIPSEIERVRGAKRGANVPRSVWCVYHPNRAEGRLEKFVRAEGSRWGIADLF